MFYITSNKEIKHQKFPQSSVSIDFKNSNMIRHFLKAIFYAAMEDFELFLESSTIHGLVYIAKNRRLWKLFWTTTVLVGFVAAGVMIYQSFKDWSESPVTTTIETIPISELKLPKVTVCPPKNTFTNLNYDLKNIETMTLDNDTRWELIFYAVELIQDHQYEDYMSNLTGMEEKNRYYNWYHSYSILLPQIMFWGKEYICKVGNLCGFDGNYRLTYGASIHSTEGSYSTKYFGEPFDDGLEIQRNFKSYLIINIPKDEQVLKNATLYFEIEKVMLKGFDKFYVYSSIDKVLRKTSLDFMPNPYHLDLAPNETGEYFLFIYERKMSQTDLNNVNMEQMPGFRVRWYFSEELAQSPPAAENVLPEFFWNTFFAFPNIL